MQNSQKRVCEILNWIVTASLFAVISCGVFLAGTVSALAQASSNQVTVAFAFPDRSEPTSFKAADCVFQEVAVSGAALIFTCAPRRVYAVSYTDVETGQKQTRYGVLQVHADASPEQFSAMPLHAVVTYADSLAAGILASGELASEVTPLRDLSGDGATNDTDEVSLLEETFDNKDEETPAETPQLSLAEAAATVAGAGAATGPVAPPLLLTWPKIYGSLVQADGSEVTIDTKENDTITGRLIFTADNLTDDITLVSQRNPECQVSMPREQADSQTPVLVELSCLEYPFKVPLSFDVLSRACRQEGAVEYSCLLRPGDSITLGRPGWVGFDIPAGDADSAQVLQDLMALRPLLDVAALRQTMSLRNGSGCDAQMLDVQISAYCVAEDCRAMPQDQPVSIFANAGLPDLTAAGWTSMPLPEDVMVELVYQGGEAPVVLKQGRLMIDRDFPHLLESFVASSEGVTEYPVAMDIAPGEYRVGRALQFFADNTCQTPQVDRLWDLSNPGNRVPRVSQCSHYRLMENGRPRSECAPVRLDVAANVVHVSPQMNRCGAKKLVVLVAENRSLNGNEGQKILEAISAYAAQMKASETCVPVDLVRTVEEVRDVLLSSEDAFFDRNGVAGQRKISMNFVNRASEILRDMEWVYRTWGDQLGGIVVIGDGSRVRAGDIIDAPAAMAWELKGVQAHFMDLSERSVCDLFEKTLFFDSCSESTADTFKDAFGRTIALSLEALGDGN